MKEEINKSEIKRFNCDGDIFTILLILSILLIYLKFIILEDYDSFINLIK